jgi:hypothetical protein
MLTPLNHATVTVLILISLQTLFKRSLGIAQLGKHRYFTSVLISIRCLISFCFQGSAEMVSFWISLLLLWVFAITPRTIWKVAQTAWDEQTITIPESEKGKSPSIHYWIIPKNLRGLQNAGILHPSLSKQTLFHLRKQPIISLTYMRRYLIQLYL